MTDKDIDEIKQIINDFLDKMTMSDFRVDVDLDKKTNEDAASEAREFILVDLNLSKDPQFLIGRDGQTLFELQRILGMILNKKLKKSFYLKLDINGYQKQKIEYLKNLARLMAQESLMAKEKRVFAPMPANERRIIHEELSERQDIITQSQGEGDQRCVVIIPK